MSRTTAIEVPDEVLEPHSAEAVRTGRAPEAHVREPIKEHLKELEDVFLYRTATPAVAQAAISSASSVASGSVRRNASSR